MKVFDRYKGQFLEENDLPEVMDFGRFTCEGRDLTYATFPTKKVIRQEILLEENKSVQELFLELYASIEKSPSNEFAVNPIIQRIKRKLFLNDFEKELNENVSHIKEIFRNPHYLLERTIEKVNVVRAKRLPNRSYQHLASHTEDWISKSIVDFKPRKILNEELELNYNVYENQIAVAFVKRTLVYLSGRVKEVQDIKEFLKQYGQLLQDKEYEKGWHEKIDRNLKLIGSTYSDEYYSADSKYSKTLNETEEVLVQLYKQLSQLQKNELFGLVNQYTVQNIEYRDTNVMVNHKHYRYLSALWDKLCKVNPTAAEEEKLRTEQLVMIGIRGYAEALIVYVLKEYWKYTIEGTYSGWKATHPHWTSMELNITERGIFELKVGESLKKRIVVVGNETQMAESELKKEDLYVFSYSEQGKRSGRIVDINPLDADSAERVGGFLRKLLLVQYFYQTHQTYTYPQKLKEYVQYFQSSTLSFDEKYHYCFVRYPDSNIGFDFDKLEADEHFKKRGRLDREAIKNEVEKLRKELGENGERLKKSMLCINCEGSLGRGVKNLNYLLCSSCHFVFDYREESRGIAFRNKNEKYQDISENEWGMDFLDFALDDV